MAGTYAPIVTRQNVSRTPFLTDSDLSPDSFVLHLSLLSLFLKCQTHRLNPGSFELALGVPSHLSSHRDGFWTPGEPFILKPS